jgi:hypothetical protein
MTLAANHHHRGLLAIIAGGVAVVGIAVLTAWSPASTVRAKSDTTPTFATFNSSSEFVEPAAFIVPSPVIDTNPQFYFGTGDGSSGYYAEQPGR